MADLKAALFLQIQEFISDLAGISKNRITMESTLERDLRIYGDDALELIDGYSKKFNVDVENLKFSDYITPEGDTILPMIISWFKSKPVKKRMDLTVSDLVNGALTKTLNPNAAN